MIELTESDCIFTSVSSFKVAKIRGNIDKIAQDVEQVKKMHSLMLSAAVQEQGIAYIKITSNWLYMYMHLSFIINIRLKGEEMIL